LHRVSMEGSNQEVGLGWADSEACGCRLWKDRRNNGDGTTNAVEDDIKRVDTQTRVTRGEKNNLSFMILVMTTMNVVGLRLGTKMTEGNLKYFII
jgi:hypothetical protein